MCSEEALGPEMTAALMMRLMQFFGFGEFMD